MHAVSIRRLLIARGMRDFGDGFVAVLLPAYLTILGFSPVEVGVIASVALFGSAALTLLVGILGARTDHRRLLLAAAALMVVTGAALSLVHDYGLLLIVAFAGSINPSGGSVSVFVPLEHAVIARAVTDADRTRMFARYSLIGALAGALGALAAALPDLHEAAGLTQLAAIKLMFVLYAALGLAGGALYAGLPRALAPGHEAASGRLGPSRPIIYKLAALFSLDSFAGGFVVQSLLALWLFERFGLSLAEASLFFFWSGVLSAFSFPIAAHLGRRFGLVNTMVWTHIPSSLCLIAATVVASLELVLGLLLLRAALSQMDVPVRSSYVMAVVTEAERTIAASFTAVPRSLAAAASPALAGLFLAGPYMSAPLLICGTLKIVYDLLLLAQFRHVKPPEER